MKSIELEVYSDVVCPWCFIGKESLKRALAEVAGEVEVRVRLMPFELDPSIPKEGIAMEEFAKSKFGSVERFRSITERVVQAGQAVGAELRFERIHVMPNTFEAHRLVWFAQQKGAGDAVLDLLYRANFSEGRDVGSRETLIGTGVAAGLDRAEVEGFLDSGQGAADVRALEQRSRELGISGVPYFVINGKYGISGAQPAETLAQAFRQIAETG